MAPCFPPSAIFSWIESQASLFQAGWVTEPLQPCLRRPRSQLAGAAGSWLFGSLTSSSAPSGAHGLWPARKACSNSKLLDLVLPTMRFWESLSAELKGIQEPSLWSQDYAVVNPVKHSYICSALWQGYRRAFKSQQPTRSCDVLGELGGLR